LTKINKKYFDKYASKVIKISKQGIVGFNETVFGKYARGRNLYIEF